MGACVRMDRVLPVLKTKEEALMYTIGLDAVCFLRFLRMCRNMYVLRQAPLRSTADLLINAHRFLSVAGLTCAVLLPINVVYNLNYVDANNRNYLLMLTMAVRLPILPLYFSSEPHADS